MRTNPATNPRVQKKDHGNFKSNMSQKSDIELATSSLDTPRASHPPQRHNISHYDIAEQMTNYQSFDVGPNCEILMTFCGRR
jgi:hypothetical protein